MTKLSLKTCKKFFVVEVRQAEEVPDFFLPVYLLSNKLAYVCVVWYLAVPVVIATLTWECLMCFYVGIVGVISRWGKIRHEKGLLKKEEA